MVVSVACVTSVGAASACGTEPEHAQSTSVPSSPDGRSLVRPLNLPTLEINFERSVPGECYSGAGTEAGAIHLPGVPGEGSLTRPTQVRSASAFLRLTDGPPRITYWGGARPIPGSRGRAVEAFWIAPKSYRGPLLVRGDRIDRPGSLGFGDGEAPGSQIRLPAGKQRPWGALSTSLPPGWRAAFVPIRVDSPGCYAVQIDGRDFEYIVTFAVAK